MGSSKKKHKKHKDKDKDRNKVRDKNKHKTSFSLANSGNDNVHYKTTDAPQYSVEQPSSSNWEDQQQSTSQSTGVLRPLRIVLKVPSSAYSQTNTDEATATTSVQNETSAITESSPFEQVLQNDQNQTCQQPSPPNLEPVNSNELSGHSTLAINSNIPKNVYEENESLLNGELSSAISLPYVSSAFFHSSNKLLSKKVKKSKKSKKSKHNKHSHSHKHSHKKHHHHHHHHTSTSLPVVNATATTISNDDLALFGNTLFSTELQNHSLSQFTSNSNLNSSNNDSNPTINTNFNTTHFRVSGQSFFTTSSAQPNLESDSLKELDFESNWHSSLKTTVAKTTVNSDESIKQSFYCLSSTDNDISQKTGSEIKLKLSKTTSSSQYTSNIKLSPEKLNQPTAMPQIVPPLIISPTKTNLSFVEKTMQCVGSEAQTDSSFQNDSLMHNEEKNVVSLSDAVAELKMPNTEKSLHKKIKLSSGKHKSGKKRKSEKNFQDLLSYLLGQLIKRDSQQFFAKPVSDLIAPGYSAIIAYPMDLSTIGKNIASGHYHNLGDFKADVKLMCDNAMKYNRVETIYYKAANKLWHYTKNKLFKNSSLVEYAKTYVKCTPLDLSLNPTNSQPSSNKYHSSSSVPFFSIASFTGESTANTATTMNTSTNLLKSSPARIFEPTNMLPVAGFDGIAPMTSTSPFSLAEPEPSSNSLAEEQPAQNIPVIEPPKVLPEKKNIVCDGMTAEELVASIKESAQKASAALRQSKKRPPAYSILKQNPTTGTVTLQTLNTGDIAASSKQITIKNPIFNENMGPVDCFLTNDSNNASKQGNNSETETKPENQLEIITSFKQQTFGLENNMNKTKTEPAENLSNAQSKKEHEIENLRKKLISTYGDDISLDYALSVAKFAKGCEYSENLCNTLMGVLTGNEHRNVFDQFYQLVRLTTEP